MNWRMELGPGDANRKSGRAVLRRRSSVPVANDAVRFAMSIAISKIQRLAGSLSGDFPKTLGSFLSQGRWFDEWAERQLSPTTISKLLGKQA